MGGLYNVTALGHNKVVDTLKERLPKPKETKVEKDVVKKPLENVYSMEEAIEQAGFGLFQYKLVAITGFAYVIFFRLFKL